MKIIYCKHIPVSGFFALNFFTLCIVRKEYKPIVEAMHSRAKRMLNHESIHSEQMKETLYAGFYVLYALFWLANLIACSSHAYKNIAFEQEAYGNQDNADYCKSRKHYAWVKYLFMKRGRK